MLGPRAGRRLCSAWIHKGSRCGWLRMKHSVFTEAYAMSSLRVGHLATLFWLRASAITDNPNQDSNGAPGHSVREQYLAMNTVSGTDAPYERCKSALCRGTLGGGGGRAAGTTLPVSAQYEQNTSKNVSGTPGGAACCGYGIASRVTCEDDSCGAMRSATTATSIKQRQAHDHGRHQRCV